MADLGLIGNTSSENAHDWMSTQSNMLILSAYPTGGISSSEVSHDWTSIQSNMWIVVNGVTGAGAIHPGEVKNNYLRPFPMYRASDKNGAELFPNQISTISGVVKENGVVLAGCVVMLFYRPTGTCIGRTWTATDGTFSFTGLYADNNYYVVYQDKAGGNVYNDIVWSLVTPG